MRYIDERKNIYETRDIYKQRYGDPTVVITPDFPRVASIGLEENLPVVKGDGIGSPYSVAFGVYIDTSVKTNYGDLKEVRVKSISPVSSISMPNAQDIVGDSYSASQDRALISIDGFESSEFELTEDRLVQNFKMEFDVFFTNRKTQKTEFRLTKDELAIVNDETTKEDIETAEVDASQDVSTQTELVA